MRSFNYFIIAIITIASITFLFFAFSVQVKDRIIFTDVLPDISEPTITVADPQLGPKEAAVTIVNFGDYQCESCATLDATLTELHATYPDDVRIVWKDMPNRSSHEQAFPAAIAARCAAEQDAFWEFHKVLFANQALLSDALYTALATELGLNENKFNKCYSTQASAPYVERTEAEGYALEITATPTLWINGERSTGASSLRDLSRIVEDALRARALE
ncbi:thioredoxin domain-containing protein [Patescibacteria group bacterium]|jgi:protein-disulfide isomerase|nr:thioredoxin domain-containing protein [Patescibacteria group bacterium]